MRPPRDLVLVGGGHSHVEVLRRFARRPPPAGVRLTLLTRARYTPYSGMLPGYVAGHYAWDAAHIDLGQLAAFADARLVEDTAVGLSLDSRSVQLAGGESITYDCLSINIGSTPCPSAPGASEHATAVKPIPAFDAHWRRLLTRVRERTAPLRIAVVGGGAGGVELLLAMQYRLRRERRALGGDPDQLAFTLFTRSPQPLPSHAASVQRRFRRLLAARGVTLQCGRTVTRVDPHGLMTDDGFHPADEVIWVTQAGGAPWLRDSGLALDPQGFIAVRETLQSVTDPAVFAAGDIASMTAHPREKAGVIAVRQGPPLARNLRRAVAGRPLKPWRPQRHWLGLISTGDRYAVASRGPFSAEGRWLWHYKDWLDRRFMRRFRTPAVRRHPAESP